MGIGVGKNGNGCKRERLGMGEEWEWLRMAENGEWLGMAVEGLLAGLAGQDKVTRGETPSKSSANHESREREST